MKRESYKVILILLGPKVVNLIMDKYHLDEIEACELFYLSDVYARLENEDNDLWQCEAEEIFEMIDKEERKKGITHD